MWRCSEIILGTFMLKQSRFQVARGKCRHRIVTHRYLRATLRWGPMVVTLRHGSWRGLKKRKVGTAKTHLQVWCGDRPASYRDTPQAVCLCLSQPEALIQCWVCLLAWVEALSKESCSCPVVPLSDSSYREHKNPPSWWKYEQAFHHRWHLEAHEHLKRSSIPRPTGN